MDTMLKTFIPRIVILLIWITTVSCIRQEVCLRGTFDATCSENEVIQMEHALYGRMSIGTCIPPKGGYEMGCQEDVLGYMDSVCSGRQTCQLRLLDYLAAKDQPCPEGLTSYLQLQYRCIPVHVSPKACDGDLLQVQGKKGVLANAITELTGQGSTECPWLVRGSPGHKIRLTLHDYGVWTAPTSEGGRTSGREPERSDVCHIYAKVTEDSTMRSITLCGGEAREKMIYLSETESLQIVVTNPKHTQHAAYFLLQYQIVGCPDYLPPEGAVVERRNNEILVKCTATGSEWRLSCDGTRWTSKEEITNCTVSGGPSMTIGTVFNSVLTLPQWILILMILAVAVIIAVPILVIGCISFRRKRDSVITSQPNVPMDDGKFISDLDYPAKERDPMLTKKEISHRGGREYTSTAQRHLAVHPGAVKPGGGFPPLPLPPTTSVSDADNCINHGTLGFNRHPRDCRLGNFKPPSTGHKYESPIALRRTRSDTDNTGTIYNELGSDHTHFQTGTPCERAEFDTSTIGPDIQDSTMSELDVPC